MDKEQMDETITKVLGETLRKIRQKRAVRINTLTEVISQRYLGQVERGNNSVTVVKLFQICKTLGVPVSAVIKRVEDHLE